MVAWHTIYAVLCQLFNDITNWNSLNKIFRFFSNKYIIIISSEFIPCFNPNAPRMSATGLNSMVCFFHFSDEVFPSRGASFKIYLLVLRMQLSAEVSFLHQCLVRWAYDGHALLFSQTSLLHNHLSLVYQSSIVSLNSPVLLSNCTHNSQWLHVFKYFHTFDQRLCNTV